MATLMFSTSTCIDYIVQNSLNNGILIYSFASTAPPSAISGGTTGSALLIIYKGTPETFPSFTDRATRASDVLITFTLGATTSSYTDVGLVGNAYRWVVGKCLTQTTASASGLASWFLLCRAGTTSLTDKGAVVGTVGLVGTGSDMEISGTNIVSGQYYTSAGIYVNFPRTFTI